MRRFTVFFVALAILVSCSSPKKMLNSGNYDMAIYKAVKKLKRNKNKDKHVLVLEEAYKKANERDREQIAYLRKEGQPDNWDKIYDIYNTMKYRQGMVKPLLPLKAAGRTVNFEQVNYDEEIINAKQKAAEFAYAQATALLEKGGKENARRAYGELMQVKRYYNNFKDVDDQLNKARSMGMTYVIFKMQNKTGVPLPPGFEEELTKISIAELNHEWIVYENKPSNPTKYDYTILVNMKMINVAPELVKENRYTESKEIPDGWEYFLDKKGNVMKDSLGNDIKKPKFKTIHCDVIETHQSKRAMIKGSLDYVNNSTGQLIKTAPILSEDIFEHHAATAMGNPDALKPETKAKLGKKPLPFPHSPEMVLRAGQNLKNMVKDIMWQNKGVLY